VAQETEALLVGLAASPEPPSVVVLEVPLLVEAPGFSGFADIVVALEAPEALRIERAVARGMERSDAVRRVAAQATDEQRAELAHVVISNSGTLEELIGELDRLWHGRLSDGGVQNG